MFLKKNTKKIPAAFFGLAVLAVAGGIFLVSPHSAHADFFGIGDTVASAFQWLLYGIFSLFGLLGSVAVTLFGWAINPSYISGNDGLFNRASVYSMWKFIRDFFNLFFILILLFSALATVFQIQKYNYKKILLNLVLMALLVNFSFPVSRFLIDTTNVPMYFFANQMMGGDSSHPEKALGTAMSAAQLKTLLLPKGADEDATKILVAIVVMFLFSVSLMVLAVMFVIRLVALLILVIFSSVGFAATVIPGLEKYASMWWDKFWQYALFGPAAMLMLFISVQFFAEIGKDNTFGQFNQVATGITSTEDTSSMAASMAMFSIPIILLWASIGLANSFSVAGAGAVTGQGQKFARWAGRKTWGGAKYISVGHPAARGVREGVKDRFNNLAPVKWLKSPSKTEAWVKGALGTGTAKSELEAIHQKAAYAKAEEMKKANVSNSDLHTALKNGDQDKVAATAAAMLLSERKAIDTGDDFSEALKALGNNTREVATLIGNASGDALKIDTSTAAGADKYEKLVTSGAFATNPKLREQLEGKMKKEGHTKVLIDAEINRTSPAGAPPVSRQAAYDKYLSKMTAEEIGKAKGLHGDATHSTDIEVVNFVTDQVHSGNWTPKEHVDAYSKLNAQQKTAWRGSGIQP